VGFFLNLEKHHCPVGLLNLIESWGQFLLKYVLSQPGVTATIPGMTKVRHVVDNIKGGIGMMPSIALRKRQEQFFDDL